MYPFIENSYASYDVDIIIILFLQMSKPKVGWLAQDNTASEKK